MWGDSMQQRANAFVAAAVAVVVGTAASAAVVGRSPAPACAATPAEAWKLAQQAVATGDAGLVMLRLSPDYRTRNALELAISGSMQAEIGAIAGEGSGAAAKASAAKAAEAQLLAELDTILRKHKAPTIKEIGTPLLMKFEDPSALAKFASIDHVAYARDMEPFFANVEKAAAAAGVEGEFSKLEELVVGGGDLESALGDLKVSGDTATATAGRVTMEFRKQGGCWMIDGRA
jgi:hypothetical protein